jgi:hypothetical protein
LESSVSRVAASKKRKPTDDFNHHGPLIERTCKILDALIVESVPANEPVHKTSLFMVFQDIYDQSTIKCTISEGDLPSVGIEDTSPKRLIDLCSWLKSYSGVFNIIIPENLNEISFSEIFTTKLPDKGKEVQKNHSSKEINLVDSEPDTESVIKIKKFGRKK